MLQPQAIGPQDLQPNGGRFRRIRSARSFGALGVFALGAFALGGGCGRAPEAKPNRLRLLTEKELGSYLAAEDALHLRGKSLEDLRALAALTADSFARDIARYGFSPDAFLEVAELIAFARQGKRLLADLPREKNALARELLGRLRASGDAALRQRLEAELASPEIVQSELATTILANAQLLAEYERRQPAKAGGGSGAGR